ncbi:MAG: hypothetical protein RLZZ546_2143 [Bacteroidota bacterium]
MPTKWYTGKVIDIVQETLQVRRFFVDVEGEDTFKYEAGQFITLDLPISDKRQKRWRSYSIADCYRGHNTLELCIVKSMNGMGTAYLFDQVDIGSTLTFKGPDGNFILPKNTEEKTIVMICTGTGLAPFRSMINDILLHNHDIHKVHLIYGTRTSHDILYKEELLNIPATNKKIEIDIVLSREAEWSGYKGYVHQVYMEKYKDKIENTKFMLCGWTNMIDEAVANLIVSMGCEKSQIIYELYG